MAYTILSNLPENITYTMNIPYCGDCFDWNALLAMVVLIGSWLVLLWMAEKKKDVVMAVLSLFVALAIFVNTLAASIFVIDDYPLVIIFTIVSIYEFFIIALKR
jgi:hypothetical protein